MAFFYGLDSSTSSSFFSSMLGTSSSSSSSFSSLYSSLGDYAAIRNGSYSKLVKAYYAQQSSDSDTTSSTSSTTSTVSSSEALSAITGTSTTSSTTTTEQKAYATIKTEANALKADASDLLVKGTKSLFTKVEIEDEETGTTSKQYDTDAIYNAVQSFIDDYNSLVASASTSTNASILQKSVSMVQTVESYEDELSALGITIDSDNTLSIDEDIFKAADMADAKSLFNSSSSLGASIYQSASEIENLASSAASSSSLYDSSASYSSLTGALYSTYS